MFAALLSASLLTPAAPVPKVAKAPDYYPTAVGTRWVYQWEGGRTTTEEIVAAEATHGEMRLTVRQTKGLSRGDEDTYAVTKTEVTWLTTGQCRLGERLLLLPIRAGDEWAYETPLQRGLRPTAGTMTVGNAEKVKVPAGMFDAVPVRMTVTALAGRKLDPPETYTRWYADGVGMVKFESASGGERVLKEFTSGKGTSEESKAEMK